MNETGTNTHVIEVEGLTKVYYRGHSVMHWLGRGFGLVGADKAEKAPEDAVYALKGVSFKIGKGEAFGVIGRNGAGKSTLLQILAGTLQPNAGSVCIKGRVTALLELGSGFNPEFTGRENIYLAGAILGIGRAAMDLKRAEIEQFADIGSFIEQPVKTYSTGMVMRVAFAVAVAVEPDVLIIDEALSVGDILFQQKCNRRLRELLAAGVTLLVVTHDVSFVLNMCRRALWLDKGDARFLGDASQCVREYVTAMSAAAGNEVCLSSKGADLPETRIPVAEALDLSGCQRLGDGGVEIEKAWLQTESGETSLVFKQGTWCRLSLLIHANKKIRLVSGGCELRDQLGQVVFAAGLRATRRLMEGMEPEERRLVVIRFKLELKEGAYAIDVGVGAGESEDNTWQRVTAVAVIKISSTPEQVPIVGLVSLPNDMSIFRVAG